MLSSHLRLRLPDLYPSGSELKILYAFLKWELMCVAHIRRSHIPWFNCLNNT